INSQIIEKESGIGKSKEHVSSAQEKISGLHDEIERINRHIEEATGIEQESLSRGISESRADVAGLDVRIENYSDQLVKLNEREIQVQQDLKASKDEIKSLMQEKEKSKVFLHKIDTESFKQKLLNLAASLKENNEQILNAIRSYNKKIKECIDELSTIDKTDKEAVSEKLRGIYSLLSNNYQNYCKIDDSLNENCRRLTKLAGLEIGKAGKERNIELELKLLDGEADRMQLNLKRLPKERRELEQTIAELRKQKQSKEKIMHEKETKDKKIKDDFKRSLKRKGTLQEKERKRQEDLMVKTDMQRKIEDDKNSLSMAKAKMEGELEGVSKDFEQYKDAKINFDSIYERAI
ncbi:unnamed protein product, partial [marine sediment metagenome]